jgi:hypothetical protein
MNSYYRSMTLALFALALAAVIMTKIVKQVYASPKLVTLQSTQIVKAICRGPKDSHGLYYNCWVYAK